MLISRLRRLHREFRRYMINRRIRRQFDRELRNRSNTKQMNSRIE